MKGESGGVELAWWRSRGAEEIISDSEHMLADDSRLSTGSDQVDGSFNGGIPRRILFEITDRESNDLLVWMLQGEAGTGKTQWCLTLISSVLLRGVDWRELGGPKVGTGIVCVIFTENGAFPMGRLAEILRSRLEVEYLRQSSRGELEEGKAASLDVLSEKLVALVKVYKISSLDDMYAFVKRVIPGICLNHRVDAIFIDSITNIYRSKVSFSDNSSVSTGLIQLSNIFKRVSMDQNCWLVVTNQTTSEMSDMQVSTGTGMNSCIVGNRQKPSLGLVWSNSVNWRIFLSKRAAYRSLRDSGTSFRELRVELSSEVPRIR
ncbi:hypothetical protein OJ253_2502 [Cryptosporidium canis]|uniref:RecA family profile 1 domain-containing protein n=1 Tax=Cryptosporidium canis TaxID=195482 RepID=A0A9D5DLJ0_9CRYT|nr:hypothetical protein OJ253_2502 [Cryptosporidium canis]